jgi:alpha-L-arabinofuranosidase
MVARHYLPQCVRADVTSPRAALDVTAKSSADGKILQLQVVNLDDRPVTTTIDLGGFTPSRPGLHALELSGRLGDENTPEQPQRIVPRERDRPHGIQAGRLEYTFPPYSFTLLRLE